MRNRRFSTEHAAQAEAVVNRRAFLQRAFVGVGTVVVSGVALGAWSRAANASSVGKNARMVGMDMSVHDMSAHDMSAMGGAKAGLRDANAIDVQDQQARAPQVMPGGVVNMDGEFVKPVRLPAKPGAKPLLDEKQVNDLERRLACPCPCNLDVFTCRTTDFSCGNSPAVHADVQRLVAGGYNADEIMKAMIGVYGNNILMAPPKEGVNLIAWFGPFVALALGAVGVNALLRSWRRNADVAAANGADVSPMRVHDLGATDEEMERLQAALRDDDRR